MKRLLELTIVLTAATAAPAQAAPSPRSPHPAVVRIIAPERGGVSCGSGALVAIRPSCGIVVTNWHVVRGATGQITVAFPDGFRSAATVLRTDRKWDLAALAIQRPKVSPIPLAAAAPRLGETLVIAGYGPGWYRASAGRCTQYVSPGMNQPYEMVELSTQARQGDSGGPILNQRGELAGVLFGAARGRTTGSYCGRVRGFLIAVDQSLRQLPEPPAMPEQPTVPERPTMIAVRPRVETVPRIAIERPSPEPPSRKAPSAELSSTKPPSVRPTEDRPSRHEFAGLVRQEPWPRQGVPRKTPTHETPSPRPSTEHSEDRLAAAPRRQPAEDAATGSPPDNSPQPPAANAPVVSIPTAANAGPIAARPPVGPNRIEQMKTVLAAIGIFAIFFHSLAVLTRTRKA